MFKRAKRASFDVWAPNVFRGARDDARSGAQRGALAPNVERKILLVVARGAGDEPPRNAPAGF